MSGHEKSTRTYTGLRPVAGLAPKLTDPVFRKRGFAEGRVLREWSVIVGAVLAGACVPESLDFPRGRRDGAVLKLRVLPARALEIQHLAPQIVERVNGYFGWAAVERLALRQGPLPAPRVSSRPALRALDEGERDAVRERVSGVRDTGLRERLAALGEAVTARRPPTVEK